MTSIPAEYQARFAPYMQAAPVNVLACAQSLGLPVFSSALPQGVSGMLVRRDPRAGASGFVCYVNGSEPGVRQRFTAAHEIGHFALHQGLIGETLQDNYLLRADGFSGFQETQANSFAADLLMPRELISQAINSGTTTVEQLARLFDVSKIAMSIRLGIPT